MRLPSLRALEALDGLARHGSMLRAAQEMSLTPSAISHQLRGLEQELGAPLVQRNGKGVALTQFGRQYAEEVRRALNILQRAGQLSSGDEPSGYLTISCVPGFALFWLCSNLGEFRDLYPAIDLTITTPSRLEDVSDRDIDVFIAFGTGNWPNRKAELLADIEFAPYCSPKFLQARGRGIEHEDLKDLPLLHMGNYEDWTRWLAATGYSFDVSRGIVFSNMYLVLTAAISGLGVAIGDNLTCRAAVRDGSLIRPFAESVRSVNSYYLVSDVDSDRQAPCRVFREWLTGRLDSLRSELQDAG